MSKRKQPQRLPPPIMHGGEAIDSDVILSESSGDLGVLLWKTVRSVRLWGELPEGDRSQAFVEAAHAARTKRIETAGIPYEIRPALLKAAAVLQPRARAAAVGAACRELSDWANERGWAGTAIEFMQAAAVVLPANAEVAREVGRLAKRNAEFTRAETWYRQAISRARKGRLWYDFSRAYIGMGTVFMHRGNFPQAKKSMIRGLRAAKRFSIRSLAAASYHELAVIAIRTDRFDEATRYARSALQTYRARHPRLPALAHDYGVYLMKAGYFDAALRMFVASPAEFGNPLDQLARSAAIARAAGALGDDDAFETARASADQLLGDGGTRQGASAALLSLARGAASLGQVELASGYGSAAQMAAAERNEFAILHETEAFLDSLRSVGVREAAKEEPLQPTPESVDGAVSEFEAALSELAVV
jgi:tetratricopeptide (TPR) repeat protein